MQINQFQILCTVSKAYAAAPCTVRCISNVYDIPVEMNAFPHNATFRTKLSMTPKAKPPLYVNTATM